MEPTKIAVIGAGYVGLTTAACFASLGHDVLCADIDPQRVATLQQGDLPIYEPGLSELVRAGVEAGRLEFVLGAANAVVGRSFVYLCVPTPQGFDGAADLSYLEAAAKEIAAVVEPGAVVVNKSTVPVGSARLVEGFLDRNDVSVVSNPEFLREGSAVGDFLHPDRVVIGGDDLDAAARVATLYDAIDAPVMLTDPASAETIKYVSNAYLATKISFVNAVAAVCEAVDANVSDVVAAMGMDNRIGSGFLSPGPGFGGSCFPKDVRALIHISESAGYNFSLLRGVLVVNDEQFDRVVDKVHQLIGPDLVGVSVAAWGLAFKAGTDDLRASPALEVIQRLVARGATVRAHDPAIDAGRQIAEGLEVVADGYAACEDADVLVVLTEWEDFRTMDLAKVRGSMRRPLVVDARNLLDRSELQEFGFTSLGIGRN